MKKSAMQIIKKTLVVSLCVAMGFSAAACGKNKGVTQDSSKLTMYVGLGITSGGYYDILATAIKENTGVDIQYVFTNTLDTTNAMVNRLENYDLPADIIITASFSPEEAQKESLLDLAAYTNIPDLFSNSKLNRLNVDGGIYQLPFCTRLIGIEYNKTLLNELGLSLPNNFNEMLELKGKVEDAGYQFAVCGGAATGHGFNYLMYLMGTEFLSGPDGSMWLENFQNGDTDISEFQSKSEYFRKYADAGLYGDMCESWNSNKEFAESRALFYYNITNDAFPQDGGDEYGIMPWISSNGSCNCFIEYDALYMGLDKKLIEPSQASKLEQAVKVMEFMASDDAIKIFTNIYPDGYVATHDFKITEDRLYYEYKESIENGYVMPWYYNYFDTDSIVTVGQLVNDYIKGSDEVSFDDIMSALDKQNRNNLSGKIDQAVQVTKKFGYEDCAKLQAMANSISLQKSLNDAGINETVNVSLIPYIDSASELPYNQSLGVVQQKIYEGMLSYSLINSLVNKNSAYPVAIRMTGSEIKELKKKGFDASLDYNCDSCFEYAVVTNDSISIENDKTYVVAVAEGSLTKADYEKFASEGRIITNGTDKICGNTVEGLTEIFNNNPQITPGEIYETR